MGKSPGGEELEGEVIWERMVSPYRTDRNGQE
jgi:hypothetical protein